METIVILFLQMRKLSLRKIIEHTFYGYKCGD